MKPEESNLTINDFETQFLKIDKTRPYGWQYYSKVFWDMRQDLCLQEVERGWKRSFGDIPYDTRIIDSDEEVYIIFEAKHSLEEFNKEELSQLKFNVRKKISGLKQK